MGLENIPWNLVAPYLIIQLILMIVALIDCVRQKSLKGPKWLWVLIIIFFSMIGPILYFTIGRRNDE